MKQLKILLTRLLVISALTLPWATAEALESYDQAGVISDIRYELFTVKNKKYRIAPNAILQSSDPSRKKWSDFKKGDVIYFKGRVLNGVNYVDKIWFESPDES
jgi:hypothetical protein